MEFLEKYDPANSCSKISESAGIAKGNHKKHIKAYNETIETAIEEQGAWKSLSSDLHYIRPPLVSKFTVEIFGFAFSSVGNNQGPFE